VIVSVELPYEMDPPPDEPPPGTAQPMLWRVAVRLHRDHSRLLLGPGLMVCALCEQKWPCFGRQLAWRALVAAWQALPVEESPGLLQRPNRRDERTEQAPSGGHRIRRQR
jgi:hypothetical protein